MTTSPQIWERTLGGLRPISEAAERVMKRIKVGQVVTTEAKMPRNSGHLRKWWALMNLVSGNLPNTPPDLLCEVIKIRTGHCHAVRSRKGGVTLIPKSISFAALDQAAFEAFYDTAVVFICEEILPGLGRDELIAEVNSILEGRYP